MTRSIENSDPGNWKANLAAWIIISIMLILSGLIISGCSKKTAQPTPESQPGEKTIPAQPSKSPGPASSIQQTQTSEQTKSQSDLVATATLTPSVTPTIGCWVIVTADTAIIRSGPGRNYLIVDTVKKGAKFPLLGRNKVGDWLYILVGTDKNGWIPIILVNINCELTSLPDITSPSTPAPAFTQIAPTPTKKPYGGGIFIPQELDGATPVTVSVSARIVLSLIGLILLLCILLIINRRSILPKSRLVAKRSLQYIFQVVTNIF